MQPCVNASEETREAQPSIMKQILLSLLAWGLLVGCSSQHGPHAQLPQVPTNSFGIYLTVERVSLASISNNLSAVNLVESPILSETDVVAVDLKSGCIKLQPQAYQRLSRACIRLPQFIAVADGQRLFLGAFGNTISSLPGPDGSASLVFYGWPNYLGLGWHDAAAGRGGYGWGSGQHADPMDLWQDPRLTNCLGKLHKLGKVMME
jgi:hypothetical protein